MRQKLPGSRVSRQNSTKSALGNHQQEVISHLQGREGPERTTGLRDLVPVLVEASPCPHACVCSSPLAFSSPQSELPPPQAFSPIPPRPPSPSPSSRGM